MPAVVFPVGNRLGLSESEPPELAGVLGYRRTLAEQSLGREIREQAGRDADNQISQDVELERAELQELNQQSSNAACA
jgi:hypothetical protein